MDAFNQGSLVGEGLRARYGALHLFAVRGGEYFFGRDVRNAGQTVPGSSASAHPEMILRQPYPQIRPRPAEMQGAVAAIVQRGSPPPQSFIVRSPRSHGIRRIYP